MFDTCRVATADPERILIARLDGTATRLARRKANIAEAIEELRELAGARADLLAEAAGVGVGYWSVKPSGGDAVLAAGLLIMAGADHTRIAEWVEVGRQRASKPTHGE